MELKFNAHFIVSQTGRMMQIIREQNYKDDVADAAEKLFSFFFLVVVCVTDYKTCFM